MLQQVNLKYCVVGITGAMGEPILQDIIAELEKPGRDPRSQFQTAQFCDDVIQILVNSDLAPFQ